MTETAATSAPKNRRQELTGTVVSNKTDKTVTVTVETTIMHSLYQRYLKRTKRFAAHDESNACQIGDRVTIVACRPMSKHKRWRVRDIVKSSRSQA